MKRLLTNGLGQFLLVVLYATAAQAQGLLIVVDPPRPVPLPRPIIRPRPVPPPSSYKIKELAMRARITDQVARVQVSQSFVNTGSRQMEVAFVFPLPYDGAIDQLTFMVDGTEYEGQLMSSEKARSIYESYIRRNQDPALLEWIGTGMFKTSVFPVPPGAERKVSLKYNQLLRKDHGLTDFLFPLSTAQYTSKAVEKVDLQVTIESGSEIKNIYSPTHSVEIERPGKHQATVKLLAENQVPTTDFRLFYDAVQGGLGANVISYRPETSEEGYFLLLATPEIKSESEQRPAKNVVFVVDRSGSMSGKKMEQAKEAMKFVLNNLREGDKFNIVAYDSVVETFRPELQDYSDENRRLALGFVQGLYAGGATNIDGALKRTLGLLEETDRPSFVVFLTDGQPTAGETNEGKIAVNVSKYNQQRVRLISLGVGYDVNSRLLDRLTHHNFGQSEYVRPDENIETHVSKLYNKISSPVMNDVAVSFEMDELPVESGRPTSRVYPREVNDLFEGQQLVLVGRYRKPGAAKVVITGKIGDQEQTHDFSAQLVDASADETYAFVAKLWAMRRIGTIIDEIDLNGKNDELIKELVMLSTKHGILTPYTSYLADDQGTVDQLAAARGGRRRAVAEAFDALGRLEEAEGRVAFAQRAEKKALQHANLPAAAAPAGDAAFGAGGKGVFRDIDQDKLVVADGVREVGKETLYRRGQTWITASAIGEDLAKADAEKTIKDVERFSEEYFELVSKNTREENRLLARMAPGEELIVKLRGTLYRVR